jgi:hypothetical protein
LGRLHFVAVVVGFLSEVGVEDMLFEGLAGSILFAELEGNILFVKFAKIVADWLQCSGMMGVGLGCLD